MVGHTYDANDRLETETKDKAGTADDRHTIYTFAGTTQTNKTIHAGLDNAGTVRETTSMAYNEMGRLASTAVTTFDTNGTQTQQTVTDYTYNDQGLRVTESVNSGGGTPIVKTFLFDPSNPTGYAQALEEYIDGVLSKTYTLGHDVITEAHHSGAPGTDPGTAYTFLHDGHGSTRALLEASMAYAQQYAYTAYGVMIDGAALTTASGALTNLLYSGEHTNANGTQYLRARFYNPSNGRFNRLDPLNTNSPIYINKYLYSLGNPVAFNDPSGLIPRAISRGAELFIVGKYQLAHGGNAIAANKGLPGFARFLRPDIMDFTLGHIAEVKPLTPYGIATGTSQLAGYLAVSNGIPGVYVNTGGRRINVFPGTPPVLNAAGSAWIPSTWAMGVNYIPIPTHPNHMVFTVGNIGGVLYYIDIPVNPSVSLKFATIAVDALAESLQDVVDNFLVGATQLAYLDDAAILYLSQIMSTKINSFSISYQVSNATLATGTALLTGLAIVSLLKVYSRGAV